MDKPTQITAMLSQDNPSAERMLKRCRSLQRLQQLVASLLAPEFARHCHVGNIRGNSLIIFCDSPAWASRLRYQVAQLRDKLHQHPALATIEHIELKVMPTSHEHSSAPRATPELSEYAASCLSACADTVNNQPLREALTRLARHRKKG